MKYYPNLRAPVSLHVEHHAAPHNLRSLRFVVIRACLLGMLAGGAFLYVFWP